MDKEKIEKRARELMEEYTRGITVGELESEITDVKFRREVFSLMVYFAHCENELGL